MGTVVVWVLILWTGAGPVVIDNIASEKNCRGFVTAYGKARDAPARGECIAVRKIMPSKDTPHDR